MIISHKIFQRLKLLGYFHILLCALQSLITPIRTNHHVRVHVNAMKHHLVKERVIYIEIIMKTYFI